MFTRRSVANTGLEIRSFRNEMLLNPLKQLYDIIIIIIIMPYLFYNLPVFVV